MNRDQDKWTLIKVDGVKHDILLRNNIAQHCYRDKDRLCGNDCPCFQTGMLLRLECCNVEMMLS